MNNLWNFLSGGAFITAAGAAIAGLWKWFTGRGKSRIDTVAQFQQLSWSEVENMRNVLKNEREERKQEEREDKARQSRFEKIVLRDITAVIEWIDAGAHPPPIQITDDLRTLVAALRYRMWEEENSESGEGGTDD